MSFMDQPAARDSSIPYINDNYLADEQALVRRLAEEADAGESVRGKIMETAAQLVRAVRKNTRNDSGIEAFLQQYDLSSDEGVLLMCIAEALLRIPDKETADRLIADRIGNDLFEHHQIARKDLVQHRAQSAAEILQKVEVERDNPVDRTVQALEHEVHQHAQRRAHDLVDIEPGIVRSACESIEGSEYPFLDNIVDRLADEVAQLGVEHRTRHGVAGQCLQTEDHDIAR